MSQVEKKSSYDAESEFSFIVSSCSGRGVDGRRCRKRIFLLLHLSLSYRLVILEELDGEFSVSATNSILGVLFKDGLELSDEHASFQIIESMATSLELKLQ